MVNKIKYLLFILPLLFVLNVNASTKTPIGYWNDFVDYGRFWFWPIPGSGDEYIDLTKNEFVNNIFGLSNIYSTDIYFENITSQYQAQAGLTYELELYMPSAKLRNINSIYITPTYGGSDCNVLSFDNSSTDYPKIQFICPVAYSSLKLSLYSSSKENIYTSTNVRYAYFYLSQVNSNGIDTSILEGQNQTIISQNQTIINNQNSNTQDIINNQNANTQAEIESQKVCNIIDKSSISTDNSYLTSSGSLYNSNSWGITDYVKYSSSTTLKKLNTDGNAPSVCFYNVNKTLISCSTNNSVPLGLMTVPANTSFIRFSIYKTGNKPQYELCVNGNQGLTDALTSDEAPNTNQDISDMNDMVASDTPISDLITMPLTLINAYINGVNSSCSSVNLGNLYGTNLTLPCIDLEQRLGSNLWGIIDALFSLFMCYNIGMLFVSAFDGITSLRDDFEGLYQPRHADTGYQPKHGG